MEFSILCRIQMKDTSSLFYSKRGGIMIPQCLILQMFCVTWWGREVWLWARIIGIFGKLLAALSIHFLVVFGNRNLAFAASFFPRFCVLILGFRCVQNGREERIPVPGSSPASFSYRAQSKSIQPFRKKERGTEVKVRVSWLFLFLVLSGGVFLRKGRPAKSQRSVIRTKTGRSNASL